MLRKLVITGWWLAVGCWLLAKPALGKDFSSFYKTTYEFDNAGKAFITQEISLVNERPNLYISEYSLSLSNTDIENVEAYDKVGPLKTVTDDKNSLTTITLSFNDKVVGKGKILSFILKYKTDQLAKKEGNLWQITIPRLGNSEEVDDVQTIIKVANGLGKIAFVNPKPSIEEKTEKYYQMTFSKEALTSFGVLATFGQYQTFDFRLLYDLKNSSSDTYIEKIPLPPDTGYQKVYYESLLPSPDNIEVDNDGNWLAIYTVPGKTTLNIEAKGKANVYSTSHKISPLAFDNLEVYKRSQKYWETGNEEIKVLGKKLKTPQKIYDYVVQKLSYDRSLLKMKSKRAGALSALRNPDKSLCSEFADLFVALCRSAGIPARELQGYAYFEDREIVENALEKDILHSWAEYYDFDKETWIMVDPTFENTSEGIDFFNQFDMTHFVFAIHGTDSEIPYPPGSYKENGPAQKQVQISFGKEFVLEEKQNIVLENYFPKNFFSLMKTPFQLTVKNNSGFAVYNKKIVLDSLQDFSPEEWSFEILPPFGKMTVKSIVNPKEKLSDYFLTVNALVDTSAVNIKIKVFSTLFRLLIAGGIIISFLLFLILYSLRSQKPPKVLKFNK